MKKNKTPIINFKNIPGGNLITTMENIAVELKYAPTMIQVSINDKKIEKKRKANNKPELIKADNFAKDNKPSSKVIEKITNSDDSIADKAVELSKGMYTQQLINFTLYHMSNKESKLIDVNKEEAELINGISNMFNFGKVYDSYDVADLKQFDPAYPEYNESSDFILDIQDILSKGTPHIEEINSNAVNVVEVVPEEVKPEDLMFNGWAVSENGTVEPSYVTSPVIFCEDGNVIVPEEKQQVTEQYVEEEKIFKGEGISDDLFNLLEENLAPLLSGKKYRYSMKNDVVSVFVYHKDTNEEQKIIVDPAGSIAGDGFALLAKVPGDKIFVSIRHKDICKKVLEDCNYELSQYEIQSTIATQLPPNIFKYIDMTGTEFYKFNRAALDLLGGKLFAIIETMKCEFDNKFVDLPRLRFSSFRNINDFELISDEAVYIPEYLTATKEISNVVFPGLTFKVTGDYVTKYDPEKENPECYQVTVVLPQLVA